MFVLKQMFPFDPGGTYNLIGFASGETVDQHSLTAVVHVEAVMVVLVGGAFGDKAVLALLYPIQFL